MKHYFDIKFGDSKHESPFKAAYLELHVLFNAFVITHYACFEIIWGKSSAFRKKKPNVLTLNLQVPGQTLRRGYSHEAA